MRKAVAAMAVVALAACATGEGRAGSAPAPTSAALTPAQLVAARQAGMKLSAASFGAVRAALERGAEPRTQRFASEGLASWATAFPPLFAPGTQIPPSEALPVVWSDPAGFSARAAEFAAATRRLADAAAANDPAAMTAASEAVEQGCQACHKTYRLAPKRPAAAAKPAG